jgi:hypothetical protein
VKGVYNGTHTVTIDSTDPAKPLIVVSDGTVEKRYNDDFTPLPVSVASASAWNGNVTKFVTDLDEKIFNKFSYSSKIVGIVRDIKKGQNYLPTSDFLALSGATQGTIDRVNNLKDVLDKVQNGTHTVTIDSKDIVVSDGTVATKYDPLFNKK